MNRIFFLFLLMLNSSFLVAGPIFSKSVNNSRRGQPNTHTKQITMTTNNQDIRDTVIHTESIHCESIGPCIKATLKDQRIVFIFITIQAPYSKINELIHLINQHTTSIYLYVELKMAIDENNNTDADRFAETDLTKAQPSMLINETMVTRQGVTSGTINGVFKLREIRDVDNQAIWKNEASDNEI